MPEKGQKQIGRFEILAELGHGAMGVVSKARDPKLDRVVAIKTVRTDLGLAPEILEDYTKRFYQEAMAAGRLNHPNIVAVYDVAEIDGTPYIVMEYVEGQTLSRLMAAEAPLPPERAVALGVQICSALEYAHARGVVHRDIKPGNILVAGGGEVKVGDFGIARVVGKKFTQTGAMLGSPSYMSPEQVRGRAVDGRSDIFSLGVVLYEALTGADTFPGENPSTVMYNIVHEAPIPIPERNPSVFPALDAVVVKALAKEPDQRFPTARALADALSQAVDQARPGTAMWQQDTVVLVPPKGARRRLVRVGAGCFLIAVIAGAVLWGRASDTGKPLSDLTPSAAIEAGQSSAPQGPASPPGPTAIAPSQEPSALPQPESAGRRGGTIQAAGGTAPAKARPPSSPPSAGGAPDARVPSPSQPPPRRATGLGSILVATNPSVEVFLDGEPKGQVGAGPLVIAGVAVGERVVTLRLGPLEQKFRQEVGEGQAHPLTYYFPPGPRETPAEKPRAVETVPQTDVTGCLSVNAIPFASVYVDGKYVGDTPKGCFRVSVGEHRVLFEAGGQRSPERTVRVTEQHTPENPLAISYNFTAGRYLDR